jgi:rhodanese-related sulfurtransferase
VRVFAECQPIVKSYDTLIEDTDIEIQEFDVDYCGPKQLYDVITTAAESTVVFDVREQDEYMRLHIPNTISLPITRLMQEVNDLSKQTDIYLVCRTGRRSLRSAQMLRNMGYANVKVLSGGLLGWEASGYEINFRSDG